MPDPRIPDEHVPAPGQPPDGAVARMLRDRPSTDVDWGLDRTRFVLEELGSPQDAFDAFHVAGTNGKGSVCRLTAALLSAAGLRTGLYLSPHTHRFAERVRVPPDARTVPPALLEACAERVAPLADRAGASRFEAITAVGFLALAEVGVEAACVEVGLGGRLDATNVLRPLAAAVVTVALDHGSLLGGSEAEVAREQGGIVEPGRPVVVGRVGAAAGRVLARRADEAGAPLTRLGREAAVESVDVAPAPGAETSFRYVSDRRPGGVELRVPMAGSHQADNAALALLLTETAGPPVPDAAARRALAEVRHRGRGEILATDGGLWLLDVAHNPAAVETVLRTLEETGAPRPRAGVVSVLRDKDWPAMTGRLASTLDALVCTVPPTADPERRWDLGEVAAAEPGAEVVPDLDAALRRGRELAGDGTVVVTGTTALVADTLERLDAAPPPERSRTADGGRSGRPGEPRGTEE